MPMNITWKGTPPSRAVRATLTARGIAIAQPAGGAAEQQGPQVQPVVVCGPEVRQMRAQGRVGAKTGATKTGITPPWIWVTPRPVRDEARRAAVLAGAYDVLALDGTDAIAELAARIEELFVGGDQPIPDADGHGLVTESAASRRVLAQAARVAPTSMAVLLTGETGTGKEVLARLIHAWSPRRTKQFVPINCAAIPNELMEAELFGYARGAFSGAVQRYDGQLMAAEGGTVFMDEIDDTPLATQMKLLRVLEDRVVSRLGENVWHQVDFRIIAATNRDLLPLIQSGAFGGDLYERLAIVTLKLPRLRDRPEDIDALARHFIARFYARAGVPAAVSAVSPPALDALRAHPWPGNIRELRNVIYEALVYKRAGAELLLSDLTGLLRGAAPAAAGGVINRAALAAAVGTPAFNLAHEVERLERAAVELALAHSGGNAAQAARLLGAVGRGHARDPGGTVRAMMKRLGLRR